MSSLFKLDNISVAKEGKIILKDISLETVPGEFISIIGPSGSGKSTLINTLIGLDEITNGNIIFEEKHISHTQMKTLPFREDFAVVFQSLNLFPHLNVKDNILYGIKHLKKAQQEERLVELISTFELEHCVEQSLDKLSGGERQRVALARSMATKPKVLFLDEPFSSLDEQIRVNLRPFFKKIFKQNKMSIFLVTHDQEDAFYFSDRIVILNKGQIQQFAPPTQLINQPKSKFVASFLKTGHILSKDKQTYFFSPDQLQFELEQTGQKYLLKAVIIEKYFFKGHFHYQLEIEDQETQVIISCSLKEDFNLDSRLGIIGSFDQAHLLEL